MLYKVVKKFCYTMCTEIEADSLEEAKEKIKDGHKLDWDEDDDGEHFLEKIQYYLYETDEEDEDNFWWEYIEEDIY